MNEAKMNGVTRVLRTAEKAGFPLSEKQADRLDIYLSLLVTYNKRMNLVGPRDGQTILETLIVDSLHLAEFLPRLELSDAGLPAEPLTLDLGAGAGLPGIPLRTLWQAGNYVMVEVRQRRVSFMRTALGRMQLPRTEVFEGRAEDTPEFLAAKGLPEKADLVLSRAFMPWEQLVEFAVPLLTDTGVLVILALEPPPQELPGGWSLLRSESYTVGADERWFWALGRTGH